VTIQEHAAVVLARLDATPNLTVCDGTVPRGVVAPYVLVRFLVQTPDGLAAPGVAPFTGDSDVIDLRIYCHCVGAGQNSARNARDVQDLVRGALNNYRPVLSGRVPFPIRWHEASPPDRNEQAITASSENVDVYRWLTSPV
jgi:hypothetical protein